MRLTLLKPFQWALYSLLYTLSCLTTFAEVARVTPLQDYVIKTLTADEGLPMNQLNYLSSSKDGFLWIASFEGLLRYDGFEFYEINHQQHESLKGGVYDIKVDYKGAVWGFDTNHRKLIRYYLGVIDVWEMGDLSHVVDYTLFQDWEGNVIVLGEDKFYHVVDDQLQTYKIDGLGDTAIHYALFAKNGDLWIADRENGIHRIRDGAKQFMDLASLKLKSTRIVTLEQGIGGSIWAVSSDNDLIRIEASGEVQTFQNQSLRRSGLIRDMLAEEDGSLWIGTQNGMFRYNQGGIEKLEQPLALTEDHVFSIVKTADESIAYSTYNNGLKLLQKRTFKTFTQSNAGLGGVARCIVPHPKGGHFIGTSNGIYWLRGNTQHSRKVYPHLNGFDITDIVVRDLDDIFVSTYGHGLFHLLDGKFTRYTQIDGLASDTIYHLELDSNGDLLLGTYNGLDIFDGENFTNYSTDDGLASNIVLSLFKDSAQVWWLSLASGGLAKWADGVLENATEGTVLENATVFHLTQDATGTIWGGASGAIIRIQGENIEIYELAGIFPRANIFHAWNDNQGSLWLTSNSGLYQVDLTTLKNRSSRHNIAYNTYLKTDGLPSNNVTALSATLVEGDNFWVPFNGGVVKVEPERVHTTSVASNILIDNVSVNSQDIIDYAFETTEHYSFEPGVRYLRFEYTAPILKANNRTIFISRLQGFEDWQRHSRRSASYTNLAPGKYVFEVGVGTIDDDSPPETLARFSFTIKPFFHQTVLFYILIAVILLLVGYMFNYLRVRALRINRHRLERLVSQRTKQLQQQSEELVVAKEHAESANRIKSEFTANISHEIRTPMNSIMGFADILRDETFNPTHKHYLNAVMKSGDTLLRMIDDLLDMSKLEADKLSLHPRPTDISTETRETLRMFEPNIVEKDLELNVYCDPEIPDAVLIDPTRYRQVLINLVGNAIKFTDFGTISIQLDLIDKNRHTAHIRCSIADTGDGIPDHQLERIFIAFEQANRDFTRSEMGSGLGLAIAKRLVNMMHGDISVESQLGVGSTFTVNLPKLVIEQTQKSQPTPIIPYEPLIESSPPDQTNSLVNRIFSDGVLDKQVQSQFIRLCQRTLIPALQVLDLEQLHHAATEIDDLNIELECDDLTQLSNLVRRYADSLDLARCRQLRLFLIEKIDPFTPSI